MKFVKLERSTEPDVYLLPGRSKNSIAEAIGLSTLRIVTALAAPGVSSGLCTVGCADNLRPVNSGLRFA
jgi:hypothetical protein